MADAIDTALGAFDGQHVGPLKAAVEEFEDGHAGTLMSACESDDARRAVAASWMIKALSESGRVTPFDWSRIWRVLETSPDWECALHLLQTVQHAPHGPTYDQVQPWLDHKRTLLRVWALDALVHVAGREPRYVDEARARVRGALADGPASLRARARALEKRLS